MGDKPVETEGVTIGTKINEKILKWINLHTQLANKWFDCFELDIYSYDI